MIFKRLHCLFKPPTFTCGICFESLPYDTKFRKMKCSHSYCNDCVALYVAAAVGDGRSAIKCPSPACDKHIRPLAARPVVPSRVFTRWCDNLCEAALLRLRAAYCPYPGCSAPVLSECSEYVSKAVCPYCKGVFCFRCRVRWHDGFTCNGARKDVGDVMFDRLVAERGWRRCPRCRQVIHRVGGCRLVKCRCGQDFCYKCGEWRNMNCHKCNKSKIIEFKQWQG